MHSGAQKLARPSPTPPPPGAPLKASRRTRFFFFCSSWLVKNWLDFFSLSTRQTLASVVNRRCCPWLPPLPPPLLIACFEIVDVNASNAWTISGDEGTVMGMRRKVDIGPNESVREWVVGTLEFLHSPAAASSTIWFTFPFVTHWLLCLGNGNLIPFANWPIPLVGRGTWNESEETQRLDPPPLRQWKFFSAHDSTF